MFISHVFLKYIHKAHHPKLCDENVLYYAKLLDVFALDASVGQFPASLGLPFVDLVEDFIADGDILNYLLLSSNVVFSSVSGESHPQHSHLFPYLVSKYGFLGAFHDLCPDQEYPFLNAHQLLKLLCSNTDGNCSVLLHCDQPAPPVVSPQSISLPATPFVGMLVINQKPYLQTSVGVLVVDFFSALSLDELLLVIDKASVHLFLSSSDTDWPGNAFDVRFYPCDFGMSVFFGWLKYLFSIAGLIGEARRHVLVFYDRMVCAWFGVVFEVYA